MSLYKKYHSVLQRIKELNLEKERLKKIVLEDLKVKGQMSSTEDGVKATLSIRQSIKYDKEAIARYLDSKGYDSEEFCKTEVELDMSKVNKRLIEPGMINAKEIAKYTELKTTEVLLVKESNDDSE